LLNIFGIVSDNKTCALFPIQANQDETQEGKVIHPCQKEQARNGSIVTQKRVSFLAIYKFIFYISSIILRFEMTSFYVLILYDVKKMIFENTCKQENNFCSE